MKALLINPEDRSIEVIDVSNRAAIAKMSRIMVTRITLMFGPVYQTRFARLSAWGFAFFALKGLAWLLIPLVAMVLA